MEAKRQVLLVDDDPAMLRIVATLLEGEGYRVRTAADGQQAVAAIETESPDFLITDWEMPHMDGLELCRRLRAMALCKYVYAIVLTARTGVENVVTGLEAGANDFLLKPVCRGELLARLRAGGRVLDLEHRLTHLIRSDMLTGLPTRRFFRDQLEREFERAKRYGSPLTCVMLDIDFFKRINDDLGHAAGDQVLREVGAILKDSCRATDFVCRHGGEEFAAMLVETRGADAIGWADRVREQVAGHEFRMDGKSFRVTISLGIAEIGEFSLTPDRLIDAADQALLVAKQSGRNRAVNFDAIAESSSPLHDRHLNDPLDGVMARDCMTSPVACLGCDEPISKAADFFVRMRINSAPVIDGEGRLAGILSEKDVLASILSPDAWRKPVHSLMQQNVVTYEGDAPIRRIYEFLCRVTIRRVVVVEDGRPAGIIDRGSLLRWFYNTVLASGRRIEADPSYVLSTGGRPASEPVVQTAAALAEEAHRLEANLERLNCPDELAPVVVGRATRMQELLNDLLAYSRLANPASHDSLLL